jgi:pimeloyl-ACP methyl ester carboxylesterase
MMALTVLGSAQVSPKLDRREERFRIPSSQSGLSLFLRYLPQSRAIEPGPTVVYVHGGTFPSGLSIAHRFDGRSWSDALSDAGFQVWGLDFHGFGESDPYPQISEPAEARLPLGRAAECSRQLEAAVRSICEHHAVPRVSLIPRS